MKEADFNKLTKAQKLKMEVEPFSHEAKVNRALFIPVRYKNDGYGMSAMFVNTGGEWKRVMDYDCFRFINAGPYLKGDFEHNGVVFFLGDNCTYSYGGEFNFNTH